MKLPLPVAWLLLAACVRAPHATAQQVADLRESPEANLQGCKPVGRFSGFSSLPGDKGAAQAREEARQRAAQAGATNFFYASETTSPDAATAAVKAYDCSASP